MKYFHALSISLFVVSAAFGSAASAYAQELPPGVFRMANGAYYHVKSGMSSFDLAELVSRLSPRAPGVPTSTPSVALSFPLKRAIQSAVEKLEADIAADAATTGPRTASEEASSRPVTLTVWNPKTDAIRYVRAQKEGVRLALLDSSPSRIRVTYTNGLNSTFVVDGKDGETVIAIRYPIYSSRT